MQPDELNLLEDGLQLWLIALRNAPESQPELLNIFPNLAVVMERSTGKRRVPCIRITSLFERTEEHRKHQRCAPQCWSVPAYSVVCLHVWLIYDTLMCAEHVQTAIQIITSCVLLGGPSFMDKHAATIVGILCTLLGNVKERGMLLLLPVMGLLLCAYPEQMPGVMEPALQKLLQLLLSDQEPSQVLAGMHALLSKLHETCLQPQMCLVSFFVH